MLARLLKLVLAGCLALACAPVWAAEHGCTASVCTDPTQPPMTQAAPAIPMDLEVSVTVAEAAVAEHIDTDESVAGDKEATHVHVAGLTAEEVADMLEE